ncbi:MAG: long-chain fatty acid--CoA ligase [Deltaproteobacteria bacterium HGW-Deltaproteobacteria-6]|jgi:long-chain acyl-CoA synthetase|nr:MAG: long-chain fatty acid--CoA ligase [Deltaproteobacteria bacterium HGW-Deltaproteobacteria-6]
MENKIWHDSYDYNVPFSVRYPKVPIQNFVHLAAAQYPYKAALDFYGSELSNGQVRNQMLRMANALVSLGIKKGDRVGIALPNCPQYVIAYYAILSAGAIVVNMNPLYTYDELKFMTENTGMKMLFTFDMVLPNMGKLARDTGLKLIVTKVTDYINGFGVSTAKDLGLDENWPHFSELLDQSTDTRIPLVDFSPADDALIQFTGGTTGLPKGAVLTHANVVAATFNVYFWGNSTIIYTPYEKRTVMGIIPYFHIYANICCVNWGFFSMATQILLPRFDMDEMMSTIARIERFTFFPTVPTMITALINHPKAGEMKLAEKIGYFCSGGAPMPVELIQKVKDMGIFFAEGWGMSETSGNGISNPGLKNKVGSIGVPGLGVDIRLVSVENGVDEVKQGEPGEILIKGPQVMRGYWNNPEETANQLTDGWLRTGDIGQMDEEGYIYIVDRKKDMIIAGGFNIYPREVDEVLYQHPKVAEAVTVGIPDTYRGETVKVFVVMKPGQTATDKEIIEFCKEKLAPYKVPKFVEFRNEIPKSAVGKILRKILRDEEIAKSKK